VNDKLLRAFIEASGYTIEEIKATTKQKFSFIKAAFTDRYNQQGPITTIDYKVTKKKSQVSFDVDSPEWSAIVIFVSNEADNIEQSIDGYGDLKPMLDYFNRNSDGNT